jgi:hypothetical protein
MTEVVVNGEKLSEKDIAHHIVRIRNLKWKQGEPSNTKYFLFPLPEDASAEVRPNGLGLSVFFSHIETRDNPMAVTLKVQERRVLRTEVFFQIIDGSMEEVMNHVEYTEWQPVEPSQDDRRVILGTKLVVPRSMRGH